MTRYRSIPRGLFCLAPLALVLGCTEGTTPPSSKRSQKTQRVEPTELPKLGDHFGPLDDGRIKVAAPTGWHVPPRSSKYVARFQASEKTSYPSIIITAEDYNKIRAVSKKNVHTFAEQIAAGFKKQKRGATIGPIEIGSFVGVSYQRLGQAQYGFKKIVVERLLMETVVAGRKYTVELRTRTGDIEKYRPHLLAVAAGLKFLKGGADVSQEEPEVEPKEEPAEAPEEKPEEKPQPKPETKPEAEPQSKKPKKKASEFEEIEEDEP